MATLLQTLLLQTLPGDTDPIFVSYIQTVLPALEREFSLATALGGSQEAHYKILSKLEDSCARKKAQEWSTKADQSLMVHVLNALLTSWNLLPYLSQPLSDIEKRLFCLGITLHDYDKHCRSQGKKPPHASDIPAILQVCQELGEKLDFDLFWSDWRQYLTEIAFLAQNTQFKHGTSPYHAIWLKEAKYKIKDSRRLTSPLRHLLAFGDIAVHLKDPGEIDTENGGDRLREHLRFLRINKKLVYHRLRDTIGILSNGIHNATIKFTKELGWQPILFFGQGVIYLAHNDTETPKIPEISELQEFIWQQISGFLASKMLGGDIGFKRDGKGLKVAPQTLELFSPVELIPQLPNVISVRVANFKDPATRKRLESDKLSLSEVEKEFLAKGADIRADRIAEFILLIQKEFFEDCQEYITWILTTLELQGEISPEQTQIQSGGVNYGWYQAAAHYVANNPTLSLEQVSEKLDEWAEKLTIWAEENKLFSQHHSITQDTFYHYLAQYLEVKGGKSENPAFETELATYTNAKTKAAREPICSLSSGEFISEDQRDSVVLFKPQQYSNKNPLGGGRIKRGISKIWAVEMLLRQALWSVPAGKLEDAQPIFIYILPAYVYSPQTIAAIKLLVNDMKLVNLKDVCKQWLKGGMNYQALQQLAWLTDEPKAGRFQEDRHKYVTEDLPFMGMNYTTTRGKTLTDAWVQPAFLALALPMLLGVKVIATSSSIPLYNSDRDFQESVILDAPAGFWNLLGLSNSLRIQDFSGAMQRLLTAYCLHLDTQSSRNDERWRSLINTVREVTTNVLNVFTLANEGLRRDKRDRPTPEEVQRYWKYAQIWIGVDDQKQDEAEKQGGKYLMEITTKIVQQYREFYQPKLSDSSHSILLPVTKALEVILTVPTDVEDNDLIFQASGQLKDALERQEVYKRPLLMDKSVDYPTRQAQELTAIHTFMTTCVKELFGGLYKGDRALLQENRNRIKSGAEFAYRWLALQEKSSQSES